MPFACFGLHGSAADFTWDGGAYVSGTESTRYWNLTGNWNPDGVPAAGQSGLVNISNKYAVANADLAGSPAIEVATGGMVVHNNGVTLTTPVTLSGGTWHMCPALTTYPWGPDRVLNAGLTVTAPSFLKGGRGNLMQINGALSGSSLLTLQATDNYLTDGPEWVFTVANSTFSGGILIDASNYPIVWANASQALGTGDFTVRSTGTLIFGANQNYTGAARTPVLYLEGGATGMTDHLASATIPFNVVVQSRAATLGAGTWADNCTLQRLGHAQRAADAGRVALRRFDQLHRHGPDQRQLPGDGQHDGSVPGQIAVSSLSANTNNNYASTTIQMGYLKATSRRRPLDRADHHLQPGRLDQALPGQADQRQLDPHQQHHRQRHDPGRGRLGQLHAELCRLDGHRRHQRHDSWRR